MKLSPAYNVFNVLIVDNDMKSRTKLKQVARAVNFFEELRAADTLAEALNSLRAGKSCDLVFISENFDKAVIGDFLENARHTEVGGLCAYILVIKSQEQSPEVVAANVMTGFNGFLLEPYSADVLEEIAAIADRIKREEFAKRIRSASKVVVSTLIKEVNRLAALRSLEQTPEVSREALRAINLVRGIAGDARATFIDVMCDMFMDVPAPKQLDYAGPSSRVKKTLEKKQNSELAAQLEEEIKEDAKQFDSGTFGHPLAKE